MPGEMATPEQVSYYQRLIYNLVRILPSQLYSDATATVLVPSIRSLSPLSMEQVRGAIPGSLSDRKSTRLNSSHVAISYAVFCLKKKKNKENNKKKVDTQNLKSERC